MKNQSHCGKNAKVIHHVVCRDKHACPSCFCIQQGAMVLILIHTCANIATFGIGSYYRYTNRKIVWIVKFCQILDNLTEQTFDVHWYLLLLFYQYLCESRSTWLKTIVVLQKHLCQRCTRNTLKRLGFLQTR